MSDELGRDGATVSMLQRKHQNFLQDLSTLQSQVNAIQEESAKLQAAYAGDKAMEITNREREVVRAWMDLQGCGDSRKNKLNDTGNLFRFFAMVRNLMLWMDDLMRQVYTFKANFIPDRNFFNLFRCLQARNLATCRELSC